MHSVFMRDFAAMPSFWLFGCVYVSPLWLFVAPLCSTRNAPLLCAASLSDFLILHARMRARRAHANGST